jgi:hypothetical protein
MVSISRVAACSRPFSPCYAVVPCMYCPAITKIGRNADKRGLFPAIMPDLEVASGALGKDSNSAFRPVSSNPLPSAPNHERRRRRRRADQASRPGRARNRRAKDGNGVWRGWRCSRRCRLWRQDLSDLLWGRGRGSRCVCFSGLGGCSCTHRTRPGRLISPCMCK